MTDERLDTVARTLEAAASRRALLRMLAVAILGMAPARRLLAAGADDQAETCRTGGDRCQKHRQCCSGRCRKTHRKRNGRCSSLGPLAGNCPRVETCEVFTSPPCRVGDIDGVCFPFAGSVICASRFGCTTPANCSSDADCVALDVGAASRCIPCDFPGCAGSACVLYAGDEPDPVSTLLPQAGSDN